MTGFIAAEGGRIDAVFRPLENNALWVIFVIAAFALVVAYMLVKQVLAAGEGTPKMIEIAKAIQEGAEAYLRRQFKTVGLFVALIGIVLFFALPVHDEAAKSDFVIRISRSLAFVLGAGFSAVTGFAGMGLAVRANVRTANAARESGLKRALTIAFRAGGVAGMFTVGLGLLGAVAILIIFKQDAPGVHSFPTRRSSDLRKSVV